MKVSVVIPTYKREESLIRLLESIKAQSRKPDEVLIVVPVNAAFDEKIIHDFKEELALSLHHSDLGVCFQRNKGIRNAQGTYILLCDDDIELEENYISILCDYLDKQPTIQICTGQYLDKIDDSWSSSFPPKSWLSLYVKKCFNHGLWTSLEDIQKIKGPKWIINALHTYYVEKGNTYTKAGWPLFVDQNKEFTQTMFYSLGASMIRRNFLMDHPFDEVLDPSGIGDNYGIALQLIKDEGIVVLNKTRALHHRSQSNRVKNAVAYKRRVLAMNYFHNKFPERLLIKKRYLIWSVLGNSMSQLFSFHFRMAKSAFITLLYLIRNKNPYSDYDAKGLKSCRI